MRLLQFVKNFHQEESGQDLVEYALVLAAVAFAVVAGSSSLASTVSNAVSLINSKIQADINKIS